MLGLWIFLGISIARIDAAPLSTSCSDQENWRIVDKISADDNPGLISDLITDETLSLSCRLATIEQIKNNFQIRTQLGFCVSEECSNIQEAALTINEILLDPSIRKTKQLEKLKLNPPLLWMRADELTQQILSLEIPAVTQKYRFDQIPSCLGPESCRYGHPRCLNDIAESWLNSGISQPGFNFNELWISQGSFWHLYFGQGFTCAKEDQVGGTCVPYSGASLMSHYCYEAQTAEGFTWTAPTCLTPQEFLQSTFQEGRWKAALCYESTENQELICEAATGNPLSEKAARLDKRYQRAVFKSKSNRAKRLLKRQAEIAHQSAQEYLGEQITNYPNAQLTGNSGLTFEDTLTTYKNSDFRAILRPATEETWKSLLTDLNLGHPSQISVDNDGWVNSQPSAKSTHAVILEGKWTDLSGETHVLIRDPNDFKTIKIFPENLIKEQFIRGFFGAISLCSANDPRVICQQSTN